MAKRDLDGLGNCFNISSSVILEIDLPMYPSTTPCKYCLQSQNT